MEYYEEKKVILERDVETLTETSLHNPLGIAFVSFDSINHSKVSVSRSSFQQSTLGLGIRTLNSQLNSWRENTSNTFIEKLPALNLC